MKKPTPLAKPTLFFLFFIFQWGGQLAAAKASAHQGFTLFHMTLYACFMARGFIWLFILKSMKLGQAYATASLAYVVIPFLSLLVLGEPIKAQYLGASLLILVGVTLFGLAEQRRSS